MTAWFKRTFIYPDRQTYERVMFVAIAGIVASGLVAIVSILHLRVG